MMIAMENKMHALESILGSQKRTLQKQRKSLRDLTIVADRLHHENMALYDFNESVYLTINHHCDIQKANFQATLLLDRNRPVLAKGNFLNKISCDSIEPFKMALSTLMERHFNQMCELELLQPDGTRKQVRVTLTLLDDHAIRLHLMDMTQSRQLEMQTLELRKSVYLLNHLLACTNEAVAAMDSELYFNVIHPPFSAIFFQIFAYKIFIGMNIAQVLCDFPNEHAQFKTAHHAASLGTKTSFILDNHEKSDEIYYRYEITFSPFLNHYTQKYDFFLSINNQTSQRLKERQQYKQLADLRLACRLSAMGEMSAAFSHEINQPLTAINAYSRTCLMILNSPSSQEAICQKLQYPLEQLVAQAEHAGRVVVNMNAIVQNSGFNMEETDINALITETLSILYYEVMDFKLNIISHLEEDIPVMMSSHIYLIQIILNLTRNSIEAMRTANTPHPELTIETRQLENTIAVYISDNGPGVPIEIQDTILNAYFTTKQQGTGIGLGVCRSLVEALGGKMCLKKDVTTGACFYFTLPIQTPSAVVPI